MTDFWKLSDGRDATTAKEEEITEFSKVDTDAIRQEYKVSTEVKKVAKLEKAGKEFKTCCPFHNEKSPSFYVNDEKGFGHCFGCGWHGDVIKFVVQYHNVSFIDAVKQITGGKVVGISEGGRKKREEWLEATRKEEDEKSRRATKAAIQKWDAADTATDDHPYLERKCITATGAIRQSADGKLLIPVYGIDGSMQSVQAISGDGEKRYQASAPLSYGSFCMGINMGGQTIICEGYATAVSVYDAMAGHVCVAFDCGNMEKIARKYVEQGRSIILASDTGHAAEKMAALGAELGCPVIIPRDDIEMEDGKKGTDFNDQAQIFGVDDVTRTFREALRSYADGSRPEAVKVAAGARQSTPQLKLVRDTGPLDISMVDLTTPPGLAGDLTDWIDGNCFRPRRHLAVASSLVAIGNIAGLYYEDETTGVTANLFLFCVAGSGTGKDVPQKAVQEIMRVAGMAPAMHGAFKSEQEIYRNLIRHQAAFYVIDELGQALMKVKNAQKRGGAAYLEGVIGTAISAFTKADDWLLLTGDAKEDVRSVLTKELSQIMSAMEKDGESEWRLSKAASLQHALSTIDNGLERPFLSVLGFSEPSSFNMIVDREWATNGFFRRVLMFNEQETVPRRRKGVRKQSLPEGLAMRVRGIANNGECDISGPIRIENYSQRQQIPTTEDAADALDAIAEWFDDEAVRMKETGLESLFLGAEIQVLKVSLILAIEDGVRTLDHVRWAYALVRRDLAQKSNMVIGNDSDKASRDDAVVGRVKSMVDENGETESVIVHRVSRANGISKDDVLKTLEQMTEAGEIERIAIKHPSNGTTSHRYRLPGLSREKPLKSVK